MTINLSTDSAMALIYRQAESVQAARKSRDVESVKHWATQIKLFISQLSASDRQWVTAYFRRAFKFYRNLYK